MSLLMLVTVFAVLVALVASGIAWRLWREAQDRAEARVRALDAAISGEAVGVEQDRPLFGSVRGARRGGLPLGPVTAVLGGVVVSVIAAAWLFNGGSRDAIGQASRVAPIDLVSMQHVNELSTFVIAGVVRNPATAERRDGVDAVASFFDDKGGFITSARAPLEIVSLAPGQESPFRVKIPRPAGLERFRLSFRMPDGTVLPHVDRREER